MLKIDNLSAEVDNKKILNGLNLHIKAGEVHAIMGPNGSGKSTLANVLSGKKGYEISGKVSYENKDLLKLAIEERAHKGLFLAFQYPLEIPGVNTINFLKTSLNTIRKSNGEKEHDALEFLKIVKTKAAELKRANKPVYNMSVGEPDFSTPLNIQQAGIDAIQKGYTKYIKSLKDKLCY